MSAAEHLLSRARTCPGSLSRTLVNSDWASERRF